MGKKKINTKNVVVILILLILFAVFASNGFDKSISIAGEGYVQSLLFCYFECAPASQSVSSPKTPISNGVAEWVKCPSNTDKCDLVIESQETGFFTLPRKLVYQICPSSLTDCQSPVTKSAGGWFNKNGVPTVTIPNLLLNQRVYINYQKGLLGIWSNTNGASYYANYNPFIIWRTGSSCGGRIEYTTLTQGCNFPSQAVPKLIDSVSNIKGFSNTQSSTSDYQLEPYKTRNFIDTYVPLSTQNVNFVNYNGQQGYCLNRQIFSIATINTNGGILRVVDANFNNILNPSVTCCPSEKEPTRKCNSNFQWEPIAKSQCSSFNPCQGADYYPSGSTKELIRYNCIDSQCVPEKKIVECTTNSNCVGNYKGSVCDTKIWQCSSVASPTPTPGIVGNGSNCSSCFEWAKNIFKSKETQCKAVPVLDSGSGFWSYANPITLSKKLINATGISNQSNVCPFYLAFFAFIILAALFFLLIILSFFGIQVLIVKKIFRRIFGKRK